MKNYLKALGVMAAAIFLLALHVHTDLPIGIMVFGNAVFWPAKIWFDACDKKASPQPNNFG